MSSLGYVMPDSTDFPYNRIDGLQGQYQVQPPVGKFNQPDYRDNPYNFELFLFLSK